ncbi:hypothetical protein ACQ4PT_015894 [Festuca glaucescens]
MDLRSGRRLGSRPPLQRHGSSGRRDPGGADRISFLSDDMILLILVRVHCVRTAVRTGILSRRWRNLWTRLINLAFRGVAPAMIEAAFSRFSAASPAGTSFQLDIHIPPRPRGRRGQVTAARRRALLADRASLHHQAVVTRPRHNINVIQLPCFQHATSIVLHMESQQFTVMPPAAGEFPTIERLSISGAIMQIGDFVARCPRLRVLRAKFRRHGYDLLKRELGSLKDALGSREVAVSIDICMRVSGFSLLSKASDVSLQELVYTSRCKTQVWPCTRDLPCFHHATSIQIKMPRISFTRPLHGELSALESLCLFQCSIDDLGEFVSCCPRLRVLRVDGATSEFNITVHSASLRELFVGAYEDYPGIKIVTPKLKQLTMEVHAGLHKPYLGTAVVAPLVEKVSWRCSYKWQSLQSLSVQTAAVNGEHLLADGREDVAWLPVEQLPRAHVLSMALCASP